MSDLAAAPSTIPSPVGRPITVTHTVSSFSLDWLIPEGSVAESPVHDGNARTLFDVLDHAITVKGRDAAVFRNLAIRVDRGRPNVGFDPDICLVEPKPEPFHSLCLWKPGMRAPRLVVEIVSQSHPLNDYTKVPDICAALGVEELFVFDPRLPTSRPGGEALSAWRREAHSFRRLVTGESAAYSDILGGHFVVTADHTLRIADDPSGLRLWPTAAEAERLAREEERAEKQEALAAREEALAAKEEALAAKEEALAAKEEAVARATRLEAELRELRGSGR